MPEDVVSQAAPAGQVNPTGVQVQEPTTPQVSTPQTEPQTDQKPLTLEDVRALVQTEATRIAQSQVAKGENRIQKVIQEKLAALNNTKDVLGLTDEQVKQAQQKIVTEAYTTPEPQVEGVPTNTPSANPDVDQAIQFMNAQIESVFAEVGAKVTSADPEFKDLQATIDAAWNDPNGLTKIIRMADKAANAKKARLQSQDETAAARVVSGGGNQTTGNGPVQGSAREMLSQAFSKK